MGRYRHRSGQILGAALVLSIGALRCTDAIEPIETEDGCIVGGDERDQFLFMAEEEADAVLRVEVTQSGDDRTSFASCSGVLLSPEWALTARHCAPVLDRATARVHFGARPVAQPSVGNACGVPVGWKLSVDARDLVPHPDLDLLLLRLADTPASSGLSVAPVRYTAHDELTVGHPVQIAGFGRALGGGLVSRQYAVEEVSALTATSIAVNGRGRSGACDGDSGGPMLLRDPSGAVTALGVLSAGSTDCLGSDEYVRLSGAAAWLEAHLGQPSDHPRRPCGSLTRAGRCYGQTAIWCDEQSLEALACSPEKPCGWDTTAAGYRCVSAGEDPCLGISDLGRCDGEVAVRCAGGVLARDVCAGAQCVRSTTTGVARCEP